MDPSAQPSIEPIGIDKNQDIEYPTVTGCVMPDPVAAEAVMRCAKIDGGLAGVLRRRAHSRVSVATVKVFANRGMLSVAGRTARGSRLFNVEEVE